MLTKQQQEAVAHVYGPMMVVAGPGSGKTMVLTRRINALLAYTAPERILVITFARKAAEEMQRRFAELTSQSIAQRVCFGTFHSVFYRWLLRWGVLPPDTRVLDDESQQDLWQEMGWDTEDVPALFVRSRDAAVRYARVKQQRRLVDFDDMMNLMTQEIPRHAVWKEYDFFLIDEFQDINPQQYNIVKCMVGSRNPNLFVVGDEDQAIYAFRGSDPGLFLHFPEDFPQCCRVDLTMNFRCQACIVQASHELIRHNQNRFDKSIEAYRPAGRPVRMYTAFDEKQEALQIRRQIEKQRRRGTAYREMAVLCRTRAQMQRILAVLAEGGVPYVCREALQQRSKPEELLIEQDLEQIWRLSRDDTKPEALEPVLRLYPVLQEAGNWRRVSKGRSILTEMLQQEMLPWQRREVTELQKRLMRGAQMEQSRAFRYWLLQTDYMTYAWAKAKRRHLPRWRVLRQIFRMGKKGRSGVTVSTMHGAKGLEFDMVWIAGLVEGECPRREASTKQLKEEERRLLYVAMTRARKGLYLWGYDGLGGKLSEFLDEIKSLQFGL